MELSTILAIITIISIPFSFWCGWFWARRKKKRIQKKEELVAEAAYLKMIHEKPLELIRHAFSKLFLLLFLLSLGMFVPVFFEYIQNNQKISTPQEVVNIFQFLILLGSTSAAFWTFRTFSNVVNYDKAIKKINKKLDKVNKQIEYS